ncbi:MAG: YihY/virulence factor BrkB family protein [Bacteroidales bacterium]|jgi:membrane protein
MITIMAWLKKVWQSIIEATLWIGRTKLPGFDGLTLTEVASFFINGIKNGTLNIRASAVAYSFFLAVFPAIIVLFTLIPYIPIENFQEELFKVIHDLVPENVFLAIQDTVREIIMKKRNDLLSFGFILAFFFASGGIAALINSFNASYHNFDNRSWINRQLISIILVLLFCVLISIAIALVIFSGMVINFLKSKEILTNPLLIAILMNGKWLIILTFTFFSISFLYYLAPAKRHIFRFISAGSTFASLFIILTSVGFSAYINNFGQYNKFYGSIGTLIGFLIWLFVNSLVLLIGFEINASIHNARQQHLEQP